MNDAIMEEEENESNEEKPTIRQALSINSQMQKQSCSTAVNEKTELFETVQANLTETHSIALYNLTGQTKEKAIEIAMKAGFKVCNPPTKLVKAVGNIIIVSNESTS